MGDAIRVVTRIRPLLKDEKGPVCRAGLDGLKVELSAQDQTIDYDFDMAVGPSGTQQDLHSSIGQSAIDAVLDGRNASIMAYGQTNSGKTFTMIGSKKNPGIVPNILNELLLRTSSCEGASVRVSAIQIVNEFMFDLFDKTPMPDFPLSTKKELRKGKKNPLKIREREYGPFEPIGNIKHLLLPGQVWPLISLAESQREYAKTNSNECSSRSHSVYMAEVVQEVPGENYELVSNMTLIDLAGSENVERSGVVGKNLTEASNINRSLAALKGLMYDILQQQQTRKKIFVNYRNSTLTKLLKNSIGGNAQSTLICNISPAVVCATETKSTLEFGQMSRGVRCKAVKNIRKSAEKLQEEIAAARLVLSALSGDIRRLERQLPDLRSLEERMSYNGIPNEFTCPLTAQATAPFVPVFKNPVVAGDGHTYERDVLFAHWRQKARYPSKCLLQRGFKGEFIGFPNKNIQTQLKTWNQNRLWPCDIIAIILQYSKYFDIQSCLLVSKNWHAVGKDGLFWEQLFHRDYPNEDAASPPAKSSDCDEPGSDPEADKSTGASKKKKKKKPQQKKKKRKPAIDFKAAYLSKIVTTRNEVRVFRARTYGLSLATNAKPVKT